MMEQLKTLVLLVLIGLSLFLTYQLWYGQKPAELIAEDVYEQVDVESPRPLEETVVPAQVVLPGEDGVFMFKKGESDFTQVWEEVSGFLKIVDNNFITGDQGAPPEEADICLRLYFDPNLPVGDNMPWLPGLSGGPVEELEVYCHEDLNWLRVSQLEEDKYLRLEQEKANRLRSVVEEVYNDEEPPYLYLDPELVYQELSLEVNIPTPVYVPRENKTMQVLNLKTEDIDQDLLLKTFFVDYNLARVIEERDGGLLYTDGEKGLRVTDTGFEYSHPRLEEGQASVSYGEALRNSSSLVSYHGGWPESMRLESIGLSSHGGSFYYESGWTLYHNGYPIITGQPTKISFNDLGLFHYTRSLFEPAAGPETTADELSLNAEREQIEAASWVDAFTKALEVINENSGGLPSRLKLEGMDLGYAVTGSKVSPKGIPAWVIIINGEKIILKADNLDIISEEDLL